jgi:hypothetical protein
MSFPSYGPSPAYNNPPIEPQNFQPSQFFISDITLGQTTIVTATTTMNYVIGQEVRLLIPSFFGTVQLNNVQGFVISLPSTSSVELNIDSSFATPFVPNPTLPPNNKSLAQIISLGDINSGYQSTNGRNVPLVSVPGAFINIS